MDLHIQAAGMGALVEALVVIGTPTAHKTQVDPVVQTVAMAEVILRREKGREPLQERLVHLLAQRILEAAERVAEVLALLPEMPEPGVPRVEEEAVMELTQFRHPQKEQNGHMQKAELPQQPTLEEAVEAVVEAPEVACQQMRRVCQGLALLVSS